MTIYKRYTTYGSIWRTTCSLQKKIAFSKCFRCQFGWGNNSGCASRKA